VLKLDFIYSLKLSSIGTNRHAKQIVVIRDLKTHYMLWPGIKYSMYSFQSKSDWIIFIPLRVKARLYIQFTIKLNRNESPRETKRCYSRSENAIYAVPRSKVPYVFFQINS
jgi:hypothetical protein